MLYQEQMAYYAAMTESMLSVLLGQADAPEVLAVLLEEQHRRFPAGLEKTFDL